MPEQEEELKQDTKQLSELVIEFKYFRNDINELKKGQKETNAKLEIMKDGYVGREEFKNFQMIVGTLATQSALDVIDKAHDKRTTKLEENQSKVVWIVLTAVILAILGTVILTK